VAVDDRVVLVTGASREGGIGRAVAARFAERGATVIIHHATSEAAARKTLAGMPGTGHLALPADLADPDAVAALVARVVAERGRIDVLVNNAAIYQEHPVLSTSYDEWRAIWRRTLDTNLLGPANLIHEVVPHMVAQGGGRIVNVSSRGAFRGEPNCPAYGASKAGLNSLAQSLAQSLAPHGVYVTTVAPGYVDTDMITELLDGPGGDAIRAQSPMRRVATADEVARVVVFLAEPGSESTTGAIVDVNGASYLRT
jgi:3-oxoacyl-[acyl-carrier protein] reductase